MSNSAKGMGGEAQIQSAVLDGHVVLVEQPAGKPGAQPQPPMRATAGHAVYEGAGEWLHLTLNPRVEDGGIAAYRRQDRCIPGIGRRVCARRRESDLDG